jgi:hypothetical protein
MGAEPVSRTDGHRGISIKGECDVRAMLVNESSEKALALPKLEFYGPPAELERHILGTDDSRARRQSYGVFRHRVI